METERKVEWDDSSEGLKCQNEIEKRNRSLEERAVELQQGRHKAQASLTTVMCVNTCSITSADVDIDALASLPTPQRM